MKKKFFFNIQSKGGAGKALVDDLKNEIKSIPKPKFKGPWDFFVYGLGNFVNGLIIAATILIVYFTFKH